MPTSWDYVREEQTRLEAGDYRVEIVSAEETESKAGNPMIIIGLRPNGSNITVNHYIVKNEWFNRNMTSLFDSFNIAEGDFNFLTWVGAIGAARLKKDDNDYLKVSYFINKEKAAKLPEWQGAKPERQTVTDITATDEPTPFDDDEAPF